jgi:hypothetical protein
MFFKDGIPGLDVKLGELADFRATRTTSSGFLGIPQSRNPLLVLYQIFSILVARMHILVAMGYQATTNV